MPISTEPVGRVCSVALDSLLWTRLKAVCRLVQLDTTRIQSNRLANTAWKAVQTVTILAFVWAATARQPSGITTPATHIVPDSKGITLALVALQLVQQELSWTSLSVQIVTQHAIHAHCSLQIAWPVLMVYTCETTYASPPAQITVGQPLKTVHWFAKFAVRQDSTAKHKMHSLTQSTKQSRTTNTNCIWLSQSQSPSLGTFRTSFKLYRLPRGGGLWLMFRQSTIQSLTMEMEYMGSWSMDLTQVWGAMSNSSFKSWIQRLSRHLMVQFPNRLGWTLLFRKLSSMIWLSILDTSQITEALLQDFQFCCWLEWYGEKLRCGYQCSTFFKCYLFSTSQMLYSRRIWVTFSLAFKHLSLTLFLICFLVWFQKL